MAEVQGLPTVASRSCSSVGVLSCNFAWLSGPCNGPTPARGGRHAACGTSMWPLALGATPTSNRTHTNANRTCLTKYIPVCAVCLWAVQVMYQCKRRGSDGIGLYRTEFLYLTSQHEPSEEDHYRAYSKVIDAIDGKPMVVRTLDLGSDKMLTEKSPEEERNPCLGLRSIRLSLRQLPMFRTQLRAILRASSHGDVRVMFPLVSTIIELRQARLVLADVMEDLAEHDIDFNPKLKIGIMVETPAAAMMLDAFIKEVDFVSVGTNDLIQYTLAVDRGNKDVADLYSACDPAVIRLLKRSLDIADDAGVSASVCGQMSGSVMYTQLLLGLGLRELSVPAAAIPEIKQAVRSVSIADCQAVAKRVLEMNSARDVKAFLRDQKRRLLAETVA